MPFNVPDDDIIRMYGEMLNLFNLINKIKMNKLLVILFIICFNKLDFLNSSLHLLYTFSLIRRGSRSTAQQYGGEYTFL